MKLLKPHLIIKKAKERIKAKYIGESIHYNPTTMEEVGRYQLYDATGEWQSAKKHKENFVQKIAHKVVNKIKGGTSKVKKIAHDTVHPEEKTVNEVVKPRTDDDIKRTISKWPKS